MELLGFNDDLEDYYDLYDHKKKYEDNCITIKILLYNGSYSYVKQPINEDPEVSIISINAYKEYMWLSEYELYYVDIFDISNMKNTFFNTLPEELIEYIFKFVPTKEQYINYW